MERFPGRWRNVLAPVDYDDDAPPARNTLCMHLSPVDTVGLAEMLRRSWPSISQPWTPVKVHQRSSTPINACSSFNSL
ncbi:hypothetical protein E4U55_005230, partial [Claviceps digitariae]